LRRLPLSLLTVFLVVSSVAPLAAWGRDGHLLAGRVAWLSLNPETQKAVAEILPKGDYETLAAASYWADDYARESEQYRWANQLHYVNVDPTQDQYVRERDCRNGRDCVVEAIRRFGAVLSDIDRPVEERREALFFLVHFVHDLHHPLHVAHPDGRGGNSTLVYWFGREQNLHHVWDTEIPKRFLRRRFPITQWLSGQAWHRQASAWQKQGAPEEWLQVSDPAQWANESIALAQQHTYGVVSGMSLTNSYYEQTASVAMTRIHMAGVRLAALLETLLDVDRNQN